MLSGMRLPEVIEEAFEEAVECVLDVGDLVRAVMENALKKFLQLRI